MTLTATQLETRKLGIGSSDCAAAIGLNPYKTPLQLYLEKTGQVDAENLDEVERVQWGNILEEPIAQEYARRTEQKIRRVNVTQVHKEHDFMLSHIDRLIVGKRKPLEVKNVGQFYGMRSFGEEYTDSVPDVYLIQVHHQLVVNNYHEADLAALIGGNTLKIYSFKFDDTLAELIVSKCAEFWRRVMDRTPPPAQTVSDLDLLYAQDNGQIKTVDASVFELWQQYHDINTDVIKHKTMLDKVKIELKFAIAEAAGVQLDNLLAGPDSPGIEYASKPLATWKTQITNRLDTKRLKAERPEIYQEFIKPTKSRVLRITKRSPER